MKRILLVEDDRMQLRALAKVLRFSNENDITTAANGQEAMEKIRTQTVDIVITDNNMPIMSGPQLILSAKQDNPTLHAILIGAETTDVDLAQLAKDCGADDWFAKPVDCEVLLSRIKLFD